MKKRKIKLSELLLGIMDIDPKEDCLVDGLSIDSRKIKKGELFLAYRGEDLDGRDFIVDAIRKGARAVFCEEGVKPLLLRESGDPVKRSDPLVPIIIVSDLRWKLGLIAAKFYDYPARKLTMIGVTGTNGKTSITQYVANVLTELGSPCGVIGTLGVGFPGKLNPLINTTPDPITLHRLLAELVESGVKAVAMEASSQGLVQGRVSGVDFEVAVFTNLTHDHLDYHDTMEDYGDAKKLLFLNNKVKYAVINIDDEFGSKLVLELKNSHEVYSYSISKSAISAIPLTKASDVKLAFDLMSAQINTPWGDGFLKSKLLGKFNLSNLLAVVSILGIMKFGLDNILAKIENIKAISGRMQVFGGKHKKPLVVVDYAHTPDALENALTALREYCRGSLWCVFGCGGDRDREKRAVMGQIAERLSDHVVITNDNPRTEDPKEITEDILQGLLCPWAVEVEYDRGAAIEYAINHAKEDDLILIAGKGSEDYQIIGEERLPFSDEEFVVEALK